MLQGLYIEKIAGNRRNGFTRVTYVSSRPI